MKITKVFKIANIKSYLLRVLDFSLKLWLPIKRKLFWLKEPLSIVNG